jgi:iron complex transport system substrate-binding protein
MKKTKAIFMIVLVLIFTVIINASSLNTKILKDGLGRTVVLPQNPQRILALNSNTMEALFNLGITPVGKVQNYQIRPEGIKLPSVGPQGNINIEAIYKLQPDLIIAHTRHHPHMIEALEATGAAVFYHNPDLGDIPIIHIVEFLGNLFDRQQYAKNYIDSIQEISKNLSKEISEKTDIKTAIIISDGDTITAAQRATGYGAVLQMLGLENIVPANLPDSTRSSWVNFDIETILKENPDIVFIMTDNNDEKYNQTVLNKYKNDAMWQWLDAVKNNQIMILPYLVNPNRASFTDMMAITAQSILEKK